ncbi:MULTISPECIES: discoidin domain-containing protein [unclassified Crossiella]|uniref:discoidin domain-containing protein n=1 Tax=unclassified Crossiella TaxID=2620835 RepID=UPI0020000B17|nr:MULTISPECIES: discoidin domain-containing protein [unclassified Crossiella]MCK2239596.1 discoidin domain-containing protein [Crossiella sp. S99.2]MCK2252291.1 discoidin domain-containing protein [Crossiella sp. S99.1]
MTDLPVRRLAPLAAALAAVVLTAATITVLSTPPSALAAPSADIPAGFGASVPFTTYEAEAAATNGGAVGPDYTQGTVASEASGRRAVRLDPGQHVEFTLAGQANAVVVAHNVPRGQSGSLSVYLNGQKLPGKLALTARFGYLETAWIPGAKTHQLFQHARLLLGRQAGAGDRVRLQVDGGDIPAVIDLADFEQVAGPAGQPANSVSITATGADPSGGGDSTAAINRAIAEARAQGRSVWIPPGDFRVTNKLEIDNVTVRGAGPWHATLRGTHLIDNASTSGTLRLHDFAVIGEVAQRVDDRPDNFVNGSLGNGSVVSGIWIQHQKVGLWLVGPNNNNLTIENSRFLDLKADGLNFNGTVTNSVVRNNFLRNTGDDALAMWSIHSANRGNTFSHNTIVQPNLANGIAIYGGTDTTVSRNAVVDTNALGSGIAISNQEFLAGKGFTPLAGTIAVRDNVTVRAGANNPNWGHPMSALRIDSYDHPVEGGVRVELTGNQFLDSPYSAIQVVSGGGKGLPVSSVHLNGATVRNARTVVLQAETRGSITAANVTASGTGRAGVYNCPYPNGTFSLQAGGGNNGWQDNVWAGCTWPEPGGGGNPTSTSTPPPGGVNVAQGKPISASSHVHDLAAARAVDGNADSYWESANNAFPQEITVDLGSTHQVNRVGLALPPSPAWGARTQTATILGSANGSGYTELVGARGYTFDPATGNTVAVGFATTGVRYLRVRITGNTGWPAGQLAELRVHIA